jgi:hypothetical protein
LNIKAVFIHFALFCFGNFNIERMNKRVPLFMLLGFFVLNLIQAFFTPIQEDEAYYWMYAQNLDWGYFDHPPMVAVIIKIGTSLFGGEFGLRIVTTILSLLTCLVLWQIVPVENKGKEKSLYVFLLIAFSVPLMHVYGFITTADAPLLFFSALYLLSFQRFIGQTTYLNAMVLGIVAALLLYSKYHGLLVIFFALLPNLKLLKDKKIYIAGLIGIIVFLPHLIWQYQHEFVTFQYHLFGRTENRFIWRNIFEYLLNSFFVLNPVFAGIFVYHNLIKRSGALIDKTLLFIFWGGISFFALTSLRDHVEPHWITFTIIPLILMIHQLALKSERLKKIIIKTGFVTIGLIILLRLLLIVPLPFETKFSKYKSDYFFEIESLAGDAKVAYVNSYPKAAMHTFYTGKPAFSFNCIPYGKKQYDYWNYEDTYHDEEVFLVGNWNSSWFESSQMKSGHHLWSAVIKHFPVISKTEVKILHVNKVIKKGEDNIITLQLHNPNKFEINFREGLLPVSINIFFRYHGGRYYAPFENNSLDVLKPGETQIITGSFKPKFPPGEYRMIVTLKPGYMYDIVLTPAMNVRVEE